MAKDIYIIDSGTQGSPLVGPFKDVAAANTWIDEMTDSSKPNRASRDSFVIEEPITPEKAAEGIVGGLRAAFPVTETIYMDPPEGD